MKYDLYKPWRTLDPWQEEVLTVDGNLVMRTGRQVGKSTVVSIKAGEEALNNPNITVMIIASVERQAMLLFEKVLSYIHAKNKSAIKTGKDRPTRHKLQLKNGSKILSLPTGDSGYGIRGHTINLLIADEAAFINEEVWHAVTPMLAVTRGKIWLLSTPCGKDGYFYRCFQDETFTNFHVSSEECPRKDQTFLDGEKKRYSKAKYAQEYLGEFVDELMRLFPDTLINRVTKLRRPVFSPFDNYFLGVDVARMGDDSSTFEIIKRLGREKLLHVENVVTNKTLTTDTTRMILALDEKYHFKKIYIDDGGLGVAVFDNLLEHPQTKRRVIPINNATRSLDHNTTKRKKTMKEDLYNNLLRLMEQDKIDLLDDPEISLSLRSVQFEYVNGKMKIYGRDTHIAEGLIRAAWCVKDKTLNIYLY